MAGAQMLESNGLVGSNCVFIVGLCDREAFVVSRVGDKRDVGVCRDVELI